MHESIPLDSAIDPQVTSPSSVRCKRTHVSCIVVTLHSLYRLNLVRRTPYACSPTVDFSVMIVAVRECIVASGSVSAPRPLLGVGAPSVLCCCLGAEWPISRMCVQVLEAFLPVCAESRKKS